MNHEEIPEDKDNSDRRDLRLQTEISKKDTEKHSSHGDLSDKNHSEILNHLSLKMKQTSSSRDMLITMLQNQLKKMEDLYKKSLDDQQDIRHKYGRVVQELGTLKIITNKLEADNKKLSRHSEVDRNVLNERNELIHESEIWKQKYEEMMKIVLDLENSQLERHEGQLSSLLIHFQKIQEMLKEQSKKIDGFMIILDTSKRLENDLKINPSTGTEIKIEPLIEIQDLDFPAPNLPPPESIPELIETSQQIECLCPETTINIPLIQIESKPEKKYESLPTKRKSSTKLFFGSPKKPRSNSQMNKFSFFDTSSSTSKRQRSVLNFNFNTLQRDNNFPIVCKKEDLKERNLLSNSFIYLKDITPEVIRNVDECKQPFLLKTKDAEDVLVIETEKSEKLPEAKVVLIPKNHHDEESGKNKMFFTQPDIHRKLFQPKEQLREKSSPDGSFSWYEDWESYQIEEGSLAGSTKKIDFEYENVHEDIQKKSPPNGIMVSSTEKINGFRPPKYFSGEEIEISKGEKQKIEENLVSSAEKRDGFRPPKSFSGEETETKQQNEEKRKDAISLWKSSSSSSNESDHYESFESIHLEEGKIYTKKDFVSEISKNNNLSSRNIENVEESQENAINLNTIHDLLRQLEKYNENYPTLSLQSFLENVEEKNDSLKRIIDEQKMEIDYLKKDFHEKYQSFHESLAIDRENLSKNATLLQQYENEVDAINKRYGNAMEELDIVMDSNKILQGKVKNLQKSLIQHQEQSKILGIESRKSTEKLQELNALLENAEMKLIEKDEEIDRLKNLSYEFEDLTKKNDELMKKLDEKDGFILNQKKEIKELEEKLLEIMNQFGKLEENEFDTETSKNNNEKLEKLIDSNLQIQKQFGNLNSILSICELEKKKLTQSNNFLQEQLKSERCSFKNEQEKNLKDLKLIHEENQFLKTHLNELKEKLKVRDQEENQQLIKYKGDNADLQDKLKMSCAELKCLKENRKKNANLKLENGKLRNKITLLNRRLIDLIDARKICVELKFSNEKLKKKVVVLERELKKSMITCINEENVDIDKKKAVKKLFDNIKFKDDFSKGSRDVDDFTVNKNYRVLENKGKFHDLKKSSLKSNPKTCKIPIIKNQLNKNLQQMGKIPVIRSCLKCPQSISLKQA